MVKFNSLALLALVFMTLSVPARGEINWRQTAIDEIESTRERNSAKTSTTAATIKPPPPAPLATEQESEWQLTVGLRPFQPQGTFYLEGLTSLELENFGPGILYEANFDFCMGTIKNFSWGIGANASMSQIKGHVTLNSGYEISDVSLNTSVFAFGPFATKNINAKTELIAKAEIGQLNYVLVSHSGLAHHSKQIQFIGVNFGVGYKFAPSWSVLGSSQLAKSLTETTGLPQFTVAIGVKKWL